MDLVIDIGNTLVKLAVFNSDAELLTRTSVSVADLMVSLTELKLVYPEVKHCILSSVGEVAPRLLDYLERNYELFRLTSDLPVPFTNHYASPKTLGTDRIALVSAVFNQYPKQEVLIIDAGTCVTYDFIDAAGVFHGGAISPGLEMRYKALHTFTHKLPLLAPSKQPKLIGTDTNECMHSGVLYGISYEIEAYIKAYKETYPDLTVVLTGGDAQFLRDTIKNDIFANTNLLLEGLLHILKYNKDIS